MATKKTDDDGMDGAKNKNNTGEDINDSVTSFSCPPPSPPSDGGNDALSPSVFPFAALVGQDDFQLCLILCAIDPSLGGVLIQGDKGTAKSTTARGLAQLMPPIEVCYHTQHHIFDLYNRGPEALAQLNNNNNNDNDTAPPPVWELRSKPTPFVDIPLGATEDRVVGSLDVAATLQQQGRPVFQPGLLAAAHRGILYLDEVNLVPSHILDHLLDAAALGWNRVQRDGIANVQHPARFVLLGTMNPEEGDLRPQLLDRFGMQINVTAPKDVHTRVKVVQQCRAWERDRVAFAAQWQTAQDQLRGQIQAARNRLSEMQIPDEMMVLTSQICIACHVDSLRADLTLVKAATALAAWQGQTTVMPEHIQYVAPWVLAHRRRQRPAPPPSDQLPNDNNNNLHDTIQECLQNPPPEAADSSASNNNDDQQQQQQQQQQQPPTESSPPPQNDSSSREEQDGEEPGHDNRSGNNSNQQENDTSPPGDDNKNDDSAMQTFTASKPLQIKKLQVKSQHNNNKNTPPSGVVGIHSGRRNPVSQRHPPNSSNKTGRVVRSVPTPQATDLALDATLRAAALEGSLDPATGRVIIQSHHWRRKVRQPTNDTLVWMVVDASGSMAARQRMQAVKGAVLALLTEAYQQRDRVGVVAFRGLQAQVLLEPTRSVDVAERHLQRLPTGGRTPLAHALQLTHEQIQRAWRQEPELTVWIILLSDGKANVPLPSSTRNSTNPAESSSASPSSLTESVWAQTVQVAQQLAILKVPTLLLDTDTGVVRVGRAKELAEHLEADYLPLEEMTADGLVHTIRSVVGQ